MTFGDHQGSRHLVRYFFHLRNHTDQLLDPEGLDLPDIDAASNEALRAVRDTLGHDLIAGVVDLRYRIDVEDQHGRTVHTLPFGDAFQIIEG